MDSYIIKTAQQWADFRDFVSSSIDDIGVVAFDLETNGLEETTVDVWGVGLAFHGDEAYYLALRDPNGEAILDETEVVEFVTPLLQKKNWIAHNGVYDGLVWLHSYGKNIIPNLHADTILMKHALAEEPPFGLKEVAVMELGPWADMAQQEMLASIAKNGGSTTKSNLEMYKADTDVLGKYCAWDVMLTYKLFEKFDKRLKDEGLTDFFYKDEVMHLYREVTIPMKARGVNLDVNMLKEKQESIAKVMEELEAQIQVQIEPYIEEYVHATLLEECPPKRSGNFPKFLAKVLGEPELTSLSKKSLDARPDSFVVQWIRHEATPLDPKVQFEAQLAMYFSKYPEEKYVFNINSKASLKWLFFDKLEEKPLGKTPSGEPKVDDEFLESMTSDYPFVKTLKEYNVLAKISGTYIEGMLERVVDNTLYTSFLQFGTTSGRYASRNPNLQNWPAPQKTGSVTDEYVNCIRHAIRARPGYKLIGADFSSLEPHIAAFVSGDPGLIDIFVTGKDFYSAIGIKQFKLDHLSAFKSDPNYLGDKDKGTRDKIKTYSLATFYGAGGPRISQVLGCTIEEADELVEGYLDAFPGIRKFIKNSHDAATKTGKVKTIFGRVRHLDECKELHKKYGAELLDWKWARKRNLLDERKTYKNLLNNAVNFQIQGTAGHVMNRAMLGTVRSFNEHKLDAAIIMTIHDEQIIEVREDQVGKAAELVKQAMENAVDLKPIKLKATPIIGNTYGECK